MNPFQAAARFVGGLRAAYPTTLRAAPRVVVVCLEEPVRAKCEPRLERPAGAARDVLAWRGRYRKDLHDGLILQGRYDTVVLRTK